GTHSVRPRPRVAAMTQSLARQAVLLLLLALSPRLAGQGSATAPPQAVAIETVVPAERYEPVFDQFQKMKPRADRVAAVHNLILRRDVIEFHLADGTLYLATPVGGRTVAAVFVGHGSVSLVPPVAVERGEVRRVLGDSVIDSRITALGLVFTDSSLTELERQVTFAAGTVGPDA